MSKPPAAATPSGDTVKVMSVPKAGTVHGSAQPEDTASSEHRVMPMGGSSGGYTQEVPKAGTVIAAEQPQDTVSGEHKIMPAPAVPQGGATREDQPPVIQDVPKSSSVSVSEKLADFPSGDHKVMPMGGNAPKPLVTKDGKNSDQK